MAESESKVTFKRFTLVFTIIYLCELIISSLFFAVPAESAEVSPLVPPTVTATSTTKQMKISWNKVAGARSYEVVITSGESNTHLSTSNLSYNYAVSPGKVVNVVIRSKSIYSTSEWSQVYTFTAPMIDYPSQIKAIPYFNSILLTWNAVEGASGYQVEADGNLYNVDQCKFELTGLEEKTKHTFKVKSIGEYSSEWSNIITSTTYIKPAVPDGITVNERAKEITLKWNAVQYATGYDVEADGNVVEVKSLNPPTYTHKNIEPGSAHKYRIRAKNKGGFGEWSEYIEANSAYITYPDNIKLDKHINDIQISWDPAESAEAYDIEVDGQIVEVGDALTFSHENLEPMSQHTYRVRAKNSKYTSKFSPIVIGKTYPIPPLFTVVPKFLAKAQKVTVSWNGITGASKYDIEVDGNLVPLKSSKTYVHQDLEPGSEHSYRFRTQNQGGIGEWSNIFTIKTPLVDIPDGVRYKATQTSVEISWGQSYGAETYDLEFDGNVIENIEELSYTVEGLEPGTSHAFRLRAKGLETTDWTATKMIKTLPPVPNMDARKVTVGSRYTSISITWPYVTGILNYYIDVDGQEIDVGKSNTYLHTNLEPGSTHQYRVKAKNISGVGEWSNYITAKTSTVDRVNSLSVISENNSAILNWSVASGANEYEVFDNGVLVGKTIDTSLTVAGLKTGSVHLYKVRGKSASNEYGAWSPSKTVRIISESASPSPTTEPTVEPTITIESTPEATPTPTIEPTVEATVEPTEIAEPSPSSSPTEIAEPSPTLSPSQSPASQIAEVSPTLVASDRVVLAWEIAENAQLAKYFKVYRNNECIDTVTVDGYIDLGVSPASAYIYYIEAYSENFEYLGKSNELTINVPEKEENEEENIPAADIVLSTYSAELNVGDSIVIGAVVLPEETTDKNIVWTSSNEDVAVVSQYGEVYAVDEGTAIIRATLGNIVRECKIVVNEPPAIEPPQDSSGYKVVTYDSTLLNYYGEWKKYKDVISGEQIMTSSIAGAYVELAFSGTEVHWYAPRGILFGQANVYIDGKLSNTVDLFSFGVGRGKQDKNIVEVFSASKLTSGKHTIKVVVVGSGGGITKGIDNAIEKVFKQFNIDNDLRLFKRSLVGIYKFTYK